MGAKAPPQEPPPSYEAPGGPHTRQPAGFVAQQPTPTAFAITTTPLGRDPVTITCPHCKQPVVTETRTTASTMAWLAGAVICLCGCWCGCCLIPCYMDGLQDVGHSCPNCKARIGKYRR